MFKGIDTVSNAGSAAAPYVRQGIDTVSGVVSGAKPVTQPKPGAPGAIQRYQGTAKTKEGVPLNNWEMSAYPREADAVRAFKAGKIQKGDWIMVGGRPAQVQ